MFTPRALPDGGPSANGVVIGYALARDRPACGLGTGDGKVLPRDTKLGTTVVHVKQLRDDITSTTDQALKDSWRSTHKAAEERAARIEARLNSLEVSAEMLAHSRERHTAAVAPGLWAYLLSRLAVLLLSLVASSQLGTFPLGCFPNMACGELNTRVESRRLCSRPKGYSRVHCWWDVFSGFSEVNPGSLGRIPTATPPQDCSGTDERTTSTMWLLDTPLCWFGVSGSASGEHGEAKRYSIRPHGRAILLSCADQPGNTCIVRTLAPGCDATPWCSAR